MDTTALESTEEAATILAHLISLPNQNRENIENLLKSLYALQGFKEESDENKFDDVNPAKGDIIGIWKAENLGGQEYFVRDKLVQANWSYWANINKIAPKGKRKRIVFLGESVARGYFYDPYFTPAQVLENVLNNASGNFEVLDLAKTDLTLDELEELSKSSLKLKPDAIVIFAGNNWLVKLLDVIDERAISEMSNEYNNNGLSNLKVILEDIVTQYCSTFLKRLKAFSIANNVKIVYIIPEYNLLDSHSRPSEKGVSKLAKGGTLKWVKARKSAEDGLQCGDMNFASSMANQMIDLDPTNPYGYELLAKVQLSQSLLEEARQNLEAAKDTSILFRSYGKPKMISVIRRTILDELTESNIAIIDLSTIFKSYLKNNIPGRDLFMDYCHLTVEGIQIAMSSAAHSIFLSFKEKTELNNLRTIALNLVPKAEVTARAHIFAAIHNAHYGQQFEILKYHCSKAVKASKYIANFLSEFVDMATRKMDSVLCKSYENIVMMEDISQYNRGLLHNYNSKIMDIDLVDAMTTALESIGIQTKKAISEMRKTEHGVSHEKTNLLDSFYSSSSYEKHFIKKVMYFQATDVASSFFLISEKKLPIRLQITFRVPTILSGDECIVLKVNNQTISEIVVRSNWRTASVIIPTDVLNDGVNSVTILWPLTLNSFTSDNSTKKITTAKELIECISPIFGEIHQFTAKLL